MSAVPTNINGTLQLAGTVRFEWAYQTRRLSYAASVLLLVLAALALVSTGFGPASLAINGAYIVTESVALITLLAVFGLPMLCVSAVVRDDEYRMRELIASTPVSLRVLLGGRLLGVCAAALAAMVVAVLALAILPQIIPTPADRQMPLSVAPYLSAFVLIVIPNTLFCVALVFGVAAVTRSTLATFAASIAIYAGYWVIAMMVDSPLMAGARPATPELLSRAARLDPFALSAFFEQTRYWTPTQRNTQTIALSGNLLINRTWVVLLSVLAIAPLPWVLSREVSLGSMSRWRRSPRPRADSPAQGVGAVVDASTPTRAQRSYSPSPHGFARWRHAFFAIARLESTVLLMSWPIRVLLALWAAMIGIEAFSQLSSGEYGTRMLASSGVLADVVPQGLWLIGTLCVLYFAADAVHRERLLRIDGVIDATPVDDSAVLTGKLVALALVPVAFTLVGYGAAMTVHATHPGLPIDPRVYGWHALTSLWPLLTFAGVAVALQVAIGNRWLALFAGLVLVVLAEQGEALGLEHPLLRFGAAPRLQWSDLDGFGAPFTSWVAFQSLWTLCALTAMSLAAVFGSRANATPRKRWLPWVAASGASRAMFAVCGMAFVIGYGLMVYATTGSDRWQSVATAQTWRANYERTFRRLATRPQPSVVDAQLDISIEPTRRRAVVQGIVTLENRHDVAIDSVWVSLPRDAEQPSVTVAGAHVVPATGASGVHVVALARSLGRRERITLAYTFTLNRGGIRASGFDSDVAGNGTFLHSNTLVPYIGYQPRNEIGDSATRVMHGLGLATPMLAEATQEDSLARETRTHGITPAWLTVRTTIHTDDDQTAHGPGALVREWRSSGQRHFEYALSTPSTPMFAVTSARYAVARGQYRNVTIELWHHAAHGAQAQRFIAIAARSFAVLEPHFGAYPHRQFRMIEIPSGWRFGAYALTGSIYLPEGRGMLADAREEDVDLMLRRIGHEVAHQWWGHTVDPLMTEGRLLVVESLAKFSEQLIVDAAQNEAVRTTMLSFDHDRYLQGRANNAGLEPTLLSSWNDAFLYYGKGALAFHALRDVLGDTLVLRVLREFLIADGGPSGAASARQLYQRLRAVAPDSAARAIVDEWFTERIVYDVAIDSAEAQKVGSQTHVVASVTAQRFATDSAGEHTTAATGRRIAVGIFGGQRERPVLRAIVYAVLRNGVAQIDTTLSGDVFAIEADPQLRLIDRDRSNNRKRFGATP